MTRKFNSEDKILYAKIINVKINVLIYVLICVSPQGFFYNINWTLIQTLIETLIFVCSVSFVFKKKDHRYSGF